MRIRNAVSLIIAVSLLAASPTSAADQKPWEKPAETTGSTPSGTSGHDKIETVIKTTGGTRSDGSQTSSTGTSSQQSYVDGFLNEAATKIKQAGGGSGWAWTWEKKWKVGPDGKPVEVKESWVDGTIGTTEKPGAPAAPAAPTPPAAQTPAAAPTAAAPAAPAPASPAPARPVPAPTKSPTQTAAATPATPGTTAPAPSAPSAPPAPAAAPAVKGIDVAPVRIAPPPVVLSIFDPVSQQESSFAAAVQPDKPVKLPTVASISKPIYEDTRVKIALELGPGINRKNLSVTLRDNEGDHAFDHGAFPENYRHIFRVPNQTDYRAHVIYEHPLSGERQEIINVQIPVLKMSFGNRTVEDSTHRTGDADIETGGSSGATSRPGQRGSSDGLPGWGSSGSGSTRRDDSADTGRAALDLTDLYTDPTNPPDVAGADGAGLPAGLAGTGQSTGDTGSSGNAAAGQGVSGTPDTGISGSPQDPSDASAMVQGQGAAGSGNSSTHGTSDSRAADSGSAGTRHGDQRDSGSNTGDGTQAQTAGGGTAAAGAAADAATDGSQVAMAAPSEGGADPNDAARRQNQGGVTTAAVEQPDKPYLLSVSIQNRATDQSQSFDFVSEPNPTAQSISPQTPLAFGFDYSRTIQRDSVKIEIFDGRERITTSPGAMPNDLVEHIFPNQTGDAYIWVYGRTDQAPFSYKVMIPVTGL